MGAAEPGFIPHPYKTAEVVFLRFFRRPDSSQVRMSLLVFPGQKHQPGIIYPGNKTQASAAKDPFSSSAFFSPEKQPEHAGSHM